MWLLIIINHDVKQPTVLLLAVSLDMNRVGSTETPADVLDYSANILNTKSGLGVRFNIQHFHRNNQIVIVTTLVR